MQGSREFPATRLFAKMPDYSISAGGRSEPIRFSQAERAKQNGQLCSATDAVKAAYRQVFKREADFPGCEHHIRALDDGTRTVRDVVRDLLKSEEWKGRFVEGHEVREILVAVYLCALARAPDPIGWNDFMATGTRDAWSTLIDGFVDCPEYTERFGDDTVPGQGCRFLSGSSLPASTS